MRKVRTQSGRCGGLSERSVNYRPLVNFLQRAECAREHEATDRVAVAICTVGVKLAATIAGRNVDICEIADTWVHVGVVDAWSVLGNVPTCDLNIVWSDHDVRTSDGAVRDQSCSVPALREDYYVIWKAKYNGKSPACTMLLRLAAGVTRCFFAVTE